MNKLIILTLCGLCTGCATLRPVTDRVAIGTALVLVEVFDQSTMCTFKITEMLGDPLSPGNNCHQ